MKFTLFFLLPLSLSFANSQSCWEATDKKQLFSTTRALYNSDTCKLDNGDNVVVWVEGETYYTIHYSVNGYKGTLVTSTDRLFQKIQVLCGNNEIHVAWDWYTVPKRRRLAQSLGDPEPRGVRYATYSITETQQGSSRRRLLQDVTYDATLVGNIVELSDNEVMSSPPTEIFLESFLKTENGVAALILYRISENAVHQISVYENSQPDLSFYKSTVSTTKSDALLLQKSNGNFIMVGYDSNACSSWYCAIFIEEIADTNVVTQTSYSASQFSADLTENDNIVFLYTGENGLQLSVGDNNVVVDSYVPDKAVVYSNNNAFVVFYIRDDVNNDFRDIHLNQYNLDLTPISNKIILQGLDENIMSVFMTPTSGAVFFQVDDSSFDVQELELSMTCGTSSPPPTTTTAAPASDDEGLGVGAIVGISAGGVVVVAGVVWFVMRQGASAGYTLMTDSSGGRIDI